MNEMQLLEAMRQEITEMRVLLERSLGQIDAHREATDREFKHVWDEFDRRRGGLKDWVTAAIAVAALLISLFHFTRGG